MTLASTRSTGGTDHYDLGSIERIPPGEGQTFMVGENEIAIFRTRDDVVYATQARCPHKAGLLADGMMGDGKVICPMHSYKFDLATGTPLGNACHSLRTYRAEVTADRRVLVWVGAGARTEWSSER
jgi:nitrite reductase (NADH) small subunit